jgi:hypothetical protein
MSSHRFEGKSGERNNRTKGETRGMKALENSPILVDSAGAVISGHCRLLAARLLGLPDVRVVVVPAPQANLRPRQ